jgi:broad specificity phosphatase PhoE
LVRHGQTTDNSTGTIAGHQNGKLTQSGIDQAKQTGVFLKN